MKGDLDYYCDNYYEKPDIIDNKLQDLKNAETYGNGYYIITDEDIEQLKNGKLLVVYPNDEYTCIFRYKNI